MPGPQTPEETVPVEIMLVRHAETVANRDGLWQGQGDSPLSERGERQVRAVTARLGGRHFDLVLASDLGRAMTTAAGIGATVEADSSWREADIGAWEGLTRRQVTERFTDEITGLMEGRQVRLGGGESVSEFEERIDGALAKLVARLDNGERAVIVTHGGVIGAVLSGLLGYRGRRPRPLARLANTALTSIELNVEHGEVTLFNDATHLNGDGESIIAQGQVLTLMRHGETEANVAGRWQGRTDGALTEEGRRQAARLAEAVQGFDVIYSSPLRRAVDTAAAVAGRHSLPHHLHEDLSEMSFGEWEDMHPEEIAVRWPDQWRHVFVEGNDEPRGGGETYAGAADRMHRAVQEIAARHPGAGIGVVSHGGAIRAYMAWVIGLDFPERHRLAGPGNTAMFDVVLSENGPVLASYNLAPHLEG